MKKGNWGMPPEIMLRWDRQRIALNDPFFESSTLMCLYVDAKDIAEHYLLDQAKPIAEQKDKYNQGLDLLIRLINKFNLGADDYTKNCLLTQAPYPVPSQILFDMKLVPDEVVTSSSSERKKYEERAQDLPEQEKRKPEMNTITWSTLTDSSILIETVYKTRFANYNDLEEYLKQRIADSDKLKGALRIPLSLKPEQPFHLERREVFELGPIKSPSLVHTLVHKADQIIALHIHPELGEKAPISISPIDLDIRELSTRAFNRLLVLATAPFVDYEGYLR